MHQECARVMHAQYCANVALKINAKLDGVNAKLLDDPSKPARFVPVVSTRC